MKLVDFTGLDWSYFLSSETFSRLPEGELMVCYAPRWESEPYNSFFNDGENIPFGKHSLIYLQPKVSRFPKDAANGLLLHEASYVLLDGKGGPLMHARSLEQGFSLDGELQAAYLLFKKDSNPEQFERLIDSIYLDRYLEKKGIKKRGPIDSLFEDNQ